MRKPAPPKVRKKADPDGRKRGADAVRNGSDRPREVGGRGGLDPTRYGDWEKAGRCIDF